MGKLLYNDIPSASALELFSFVRKIKNRDMRTNSVFTAPVLEDLCQKNLAWIAIGENAAVVLCPDTENIVRVSYYAKDAAALSEAAGLLPNTPVRMVCDIIGRDLAAEMQVKELEAQGFLLYAKFQRMTCADLQIDSTLDFSMVEPAVAADAREIYDMLHQEFDPLTARFPALETLEERIRNSEVFVVRRDGKIAGFCVFSSHNRQIALLEYVIVRPEYRRDKIAKTILHYKWQRQNQSRQYMLWINTQCTGPIRSHESNGFQADGLYDYILLAGEDTSHSEEGETTCS